MMNRVVLAVAASLVAVSAAAQEAAPPAGGFTFRRVLPPTGSGPRITVQIDPVEQARLLAVLPPPPVIVTPGEGGARPAESGFDWFWAEVPAEIDRGAGRFAQALRILGTPPDGTALPRFSLQHLQDIAERHGPDILRATVGTRVSPALVLAVIAVESAGRADAVSSAGAQGLMQLIPATAERFGVADPVDAAQNIAGGVAYLDWLMGEFDRDVVLTLAGYNAGENAVRSSGGVPPYAETRAYVPKVLTAWTVARGLCLTPPELASDPCAFRLASAGG